MKDLGKTKRYCGNCNSHNPYEYPIKIFCLTRYAQKKDPIVNTLWHCNFWKQTTQECHCIRDAINAGKSLQ